ncbi:MAG: hypothetical protein PHQ23_08875, partial [Candidatus Wallbacteria bacterium]|nr:hypothetical protein [Candidatus Wallbacteria bacterium]
MGNLDITRRKVNDITIIRISGEFDQEGDAIFSTFIAGLAEEDLKKVVVTLKRVSWLGSASFNVFVELIRRVESC